VREKPMSLRTTFPKYSVWTELVHTLARILGSKVADSEERRHQANPASTCIYYYAPPTYWSCVYSQVKVCQSSVQGVVSGGRECS